MIRHYLQAALINVSRAPLTAATNIVTLALGLACFIAAYGVSVYWRSGDAYHAGAERMFYIEQRFSSDNAFSKRAAIWTSARVGDELRASVPELEVVADIELISGDSGFAVSSGRSKMFLNAARTDASLFEMFAFDFIEGDRASAMRTPSDVVLTQEAARRLFGSTPALGREVLISGKYPANVSAVIGPIRQPSFLGQDEASPTRFDILVPKQPNTSGALPRWGQLGGTTIVRLPPSMTVSSFQTRLDALAATAKDFSEPIYLTARPVSQILGKIVDAQFVSGAKGKLGTSTILFVLGSLILLISCINYANLATAVVAGRMKEVGLRRALGARSASLFFQYLVEAGLLAVPALFLALLVLLLAAPVFQHTLGANVLYFLNDGFGGVPALTAIAIATMLAAAVWPALTIARARATDALGSAAATGRTGLLPRLLVGLQFLSASFLIIIVAVAHMQYLHLREGVTDGSDDPVVVLDYVSNKDIQFDTLAREISRSPYVKSLSSVTTTPWTAEGSARMYVLGTSATAPTPNTSFLTKAVGPRYFETAGRKLVAGRTFEVARDRGPPIFYGWEPGTPRPADLPALIIDTWTARSLGFQTPEAALGQTLYEYIARFLPGGPDDSRPGDPAGRIIGVVEPDGPGPTLTAQGMVFEFDPDFRAAFVPVMRIDGRHVEAALADISRAWTALVPNIPARPRFSDALFERTYEPFHKIAAVFYVLAGCAFVISTTALIGIAVHQASRRRNEIAVRKTLGSSVGRITRLLLADFSLPVLIGNLLAWPIGYAASLAYLATFADRIEITAISFILSLLITLVVAWAAIIGVVIRAASVRPAEVLRRA